MSWIHWNRERTIATAIGLALFGLQSVADAGTKIAVIDGGESVGQGWCFFFEQYGYECTLFPKSGPTASLDAFAVVIDMSEEWADSEQLLAAVLKSGRGVITWDQAPDALGLSTNPVVRDWIGTNSLAFSSGACKVTSSDPILGDLKPGAFIGNCGKIPCRALADTNGHPNAKVLARLNFGTGNIGLLRNTWQHGQSVFFNRGIVKAEPWLGAVRELSVRTIPAISNWGILILGISILVGASIAIRRVRIESVASTKSLCS